MTFTDYLNMHRLETALQLLEETAKKMTTVAYESGFQSARSFNNFFRAKMGMSPTEYKNASLR